MWFAMIDLPHMMKKVHYNANICHVYGEKPCKNKTVPCKTRTRDMVACNSSTKST